LEAILRELWAQWVLGYDETDFVSALSALLTEEIEPNRMVTDLVCLDNPPRVFAQLRCPEKQYKVLVKL
jgi:threonine dehydrogenase-like Zn-dependent dehydrogenase